MGAEPLYAGAGPAAFPCLVSFRDSPARGRCACLAGCLYFHVSEPEKGTMLATGQFCLLSGLSLLYLRPASSPGESVAIPRIRCELRRESLCGRLRHARTLRALLYRIAAPEVTLAAAVAPGNRRCASGDFRACICFV